MHRGKEEVPHLYIWIQGSRPAVPENSEQVYVRAFHLISEHTSFD